MLFARRGFTPLLFALLLSARANAGEGLQLLSVLPATAGRTESLVVATDSQLKQELRAGISPDRFRVVAGHGSAQVTGVRRIADTQERVLTVLAFDATGSFVPYWNDAMHLARTFADGLPPTHPQATRVVTFGIKLDDFGEATTAADLKTLLDALAKRRPNQQATRLKNFVLEATRMASAEQPLASHGIRQVIVFTDAGEESDAYDIKTVTAEALSLGVQLHVMTFYRPGHAQASLAKRLDEMRLLAESTGGQSIQVDKASDAEKAVRQLASASIDAAWLTVEFCGVSSAQAHFDDTLSIEAVRGGARVAFTAPLPFRQDAAGSAIAPCQVCQPACSAGSACVNGACAAVAQQPETAPAVRSQPSTSNLWWLWVLIAVALVGLLVFVWSWRRKELPPTPVPAPAPLQPDPVIESEPEPAPAAPWRDPFDSLPFTRLSLVQGPPTAPATISLNKAELIVGGDPDAADQIIPVDAISGRHARFELQKDGSVFVTDLKSSNGTYVDGRRLLPDERCPLRPGQVISFSRKTQFRLEQPSRTGGLESAAINSPHPQVQAEPAPVPDGNPRPRKAKTIYAPINRKGDDE
jgi:pSer/pThr/pTyr-binding forkhead associated (FHA) protein